MNPTTYPAGTEGLTPAAEANIQQPPSAADLLQFADALNITVARVRTVTSVFLYDGQTRISASGKSFAEALRAAWGNWQAELARRAAMERNMEILD